MVVATLSAKVAFPPVPLPQWKVGPSKAYPL